MEKADAQLLEEARAHFKTTTFWRTVPRRIMGAD
jgi:hypothetical protein